MNIAIRGCKKSDDLLFSMLIHNYEYNIVCIIDINSELWGQTINGVEVVSPMKGLVLYREKRIEKIFVNAYLGEVTVTNIYAEMMKMGFEKEDICVPSVFSLNTEHNISLLDITQQKYNIDNFRQLYYLEYHIADECNLNCAACSHFSPLVKEASHATIDEVMKDLLQLREIVDYIEWIRIMGGEPFLNSEWLDFLKITRNIWPYSKISIVTNGLLLCQLSDAQIEEINKLNVWIDISLYKPLWDKIDDIIQKLRGEGIKVEVNGTPIFEFTTCFDLHSEEDYAKKRKECHAPCNNLYKGKITPCPIMMYVGRFNEYFNTALPEETPVDIYDANIDFKTLKKLLSKPMHICRYCNQSKTKDWERVSAGEKCKIDKWIINN